MRIVLYTHSIVSDWNHGNAHFLRGVLRELEARGHQTVALEPSDGWSRGNLLADQGRDALARFADDFPELTAITYDATFDHAAAVSDADVVIVHEWNDPALIAHLGSLRRAGAAFTLLFHDTHHRAASDADAIADLMLSEYDAVLVFGEVLRERYVKRGWGQDVFTWHEAADTRLFYPMSLSEQDGTLIWIGNWGDDERARELSEFLIQPACDLGLSGSVRGVRYPTQALEQLRQSPLRYGGWIANADAPNAFARHRMTVHIPRRPYVQALPGIPTIRVFEALAAGIPLICAPWDDAEGLFRVGHDYFQAPDGAAMRTHMTLLREDRAAAAALAAHGLATIRRRHTCAHRVDELFAILARRGSVRVRQALSAAVAAG